MTNESTDRIWTATELATALRVGAGLIRQMCQTGELKGHRVGRKHWRIPASEVHRLWPGLIGDQDIAQAA